MMKGLKSSASSKNLSQESNILKELSRGDSLKSTKHYEREGILKQLQHDQFNNFDVCHWSNMSNQRQDTQQTDTDCESMSI